MARAMHARMRHGARQAGTNTRHTYLEERGVERRRNVAWHRRRSSGVGLPSHQSEGESCVVLADTWRLRFSDLSSRVSSRRVPWRLGSGVASPVSSMMPICRLTPLICAGDTLSEDVAGELRCGLGLLRSKRESNSQRSTRLAAAKSRTLPVWPSASQRARAVRSLVDSLRPSTRPMANKASSSILKRGRQPRREDVLRGVVAAKRRFARVSDEFGSNSDEIAPSKTITARD